MNIASQLALSPDGSQKGVALILVGTALPALRHEPLAKCAPCGADVRA